MKDITIVCLAGGDSERFWPLNDKNSLPFLGKPLLYQTIAQFSKFGFQNIVVVVNHNNELLLHRLKNDFRDLNLSFILQKDPRGQAGAIISAKGKIQGKKILVVNASDIYEDLLLSAFVKELKTNPKGIVTGITQDAYFPGGYLTLSGNKIVSIVEKPAPEKRPSNITTMVFYYFQNADFLLSAISKINSSADDIFEQSLNLLLKKGLDFKFLHYKGFFGYLKYPWHVLNIASYYLDKVKRTNGKGVIIEKSAIISDNVFLEDGVRVLENAKIVGPAYIGRGTIIGNNVLIRESMIGENCVVGNGCEIARSYIGNNCWFHTNYIGDSVIRSNVSMGSGTVLANFRLDEGSIKSKIAGQLLDSEKVKLGAIIGDNTRIGVNASIMPGVKIGRNCFLGAGVVLDKDLPDNKYCTLIKGNYLVEDNKVDISTQTRRSQRTELKFK